MVINTEEGGGGRDVNKIMEVYLDFDMLHFCVTFKFSCDEAWNPAFAVRRSYINNDRTSWLVTRVMTQFVGTPPRTLDLKWCGYTKIMSSRKSSIFLKCVGGAVFHILFYRYVNNRKTVVKCCLKKSLA